MNQKNINLLDSELTFYEIHNTGYDPEKRIIDFWKKYELIGIRNTLLDKVVNIPFLQIIILIIVYTLISMFSLSAQTPHKDSGAGGSFKTIQGRIVNDNGSPISGATITLKRTDIKAVTNEKGYFQIVITVDSSVLIISNIGYHSREFKISGTSDVGNIVLSTAENVLEEVEVANTGYQSLKKQKTVGSFVQIDSNLIERATSTNILDRIKDIAPGVYFQNKDPQLSTAARTTNMRNNGIVIRGESSLSGSKEPLIILDNFPYDGDLKNINPNDIESITILKDASSAAIWGARSGNGVIVINSKKGIFNQKQLLELKSNVTIIDKPDLFYSQNFLKSSSYIDVEKYLYEQGYFDSQLNNVNSFPTISPAVELLKKYDLATTNTEKENIENQISMLKKKNVRQDYEKYIYQKSVNQQYTISLRGGTNNTAYSFSAGYDNNKNNLKRNGYNRITINSQNTYKPVQNLELTGALIYSQSTTFNNNIFSYGSPLGIGGAYLNLYPYAILANENGEAQSIPQGMRTSYLDSVRLIGFLDWHFRPLNEISLSDNSTKMKDLLMRFSANYQIIPQISIALNYQNEIQTALDNNYRSLDTYYVRDLINQFSSFDSSTGVITYNFPKNGILDLRQITQTQNNLRGQVNYSHVFEKNDINIIAGSELGETKVSGFNRTSYGYNNELGISTDNLNYNTFYSTNPTGIRTIPAPDGAVFETLRRTVSYFAIGNYNYDRRYTLSLTARKDGANLFGAKANDKIQPFLSGGFGWSISNEKFYNLSWLSILRLRMSYGYQGNTNQISSAYLTGRYITDMETSIRAMIISTAPNPRLQWENVRNINLGLDFATKDNLLSGTIELYKKNGHDLIQPTDLSPQTGFTSYLANTASTETRGFDLTLTSQNLKERIKWNTTLLFSSINDKVIRYDVPRTASSINFTTGNYAIGKPLNSIFSYKWAGLNPDNGNPRGYLNGQISEDYLGIINNYNIDSLVYNGSSVPTIFGALRNDFSFKGFSISMNISYRFGYFFRRSSTSLNYTDILQLGQHSDYERRWQKSGDELKTDIPSLIYPANNNRDVFYQNSESLVASGDHIRLQDIRLSYQFLPKRIGMSKFQDMNLFIYANNLGIMWRKNKLGIDPSAVGNTTNLYPMPFSISFGFSTKF